MRLLIDEDLPRSLAVALAACGIEATHLLDLGLRGSSDDEVYRHALSRESALLTADLGFGNPLRFPVADRPGILIARFPSELPVDALNAEIVKTLRDLTEEDLHGAITVIEPGRVRTRRKR